jgi:hypothetical protein
MKNKKTETEDKLSAQGHSKSIWSSRVKSIFSLSLQPKVYKPPASFYLLEISEMKSLLPEDC